MLIFKGIIIGIGKIIPGVSGSVLAISMGIYDKLINSVNSFFKEPKKNFKFLCQIGIGVIISVIFFSNIIISCLNKYYLITMFFFIGLIVGSLNDIKINIEKKYNYLTIISFIIVTIFGLISINNEVDITNNFFNFLFFILVGFIDALTMIIPGISGTATLMMIGAYNTLIETFSTVLDFNLLTTNIKILFPFGIGMIFGIIFTVKLVSFLFKNYKSKTYNIIYGFTISTIFLMALRCINSSYNLTMLILGFIAFIIAFFIIKKINHYISND